MVPAIVGRDSFVCVGLCPKSVQVGSVCTCRLYFDDAFFAPRESAEDGVDRSSHRMSLRNNLLDGV